jgi:hypothetical protein
MENALLKFVVLLENALLKFVVLQNKFKGMKNFKINISSMQYEVINLGTKKNHQNVNLGTKFSPTERVAFVNLFREYKDMFYWKYSDLKNYDTKIIQHVIPLKNDANPFQQKINM